MKHWHEECGVFGIWNHPEASRLSYLGLYALQHRGQESAGIVTLERATKEQKHHKALGLVHEVFNESILDRLTGDAAIGHVRYSTTGQNLVQNAQPLFAHVRGHSISIAHNGNLTNSESLRQGLTDSGAIFQGTNDTECILHLLARQKEGKLKDKMLSVLPKLKGAFSLIVLNGECLMGIRDGFGFRPLVLGRVTNAKGEKVPVLASETCAFDLIGAELEREIKPGEVFWVDGDGEHSVQFEERAQFAQCSFEHVYFSRPDSIVFGTSVYQARKKMGAILARDHGVEADLVIPVPDSGVPAAIGYAAASGLPFELGIIRNHYVGRTFIEPKQSIRSFGVKVKLNPQAEILRGKRVIVIDDSIVRGTTCKKIIGLIRQAGAKEVHLRIAAPPTVGACYYGVDTPQTEELIASHKSIDEIRKYVDADTLGYLSVDGLRESLGDLPTSVGPAMAVSTTQTSSDQKSCGGKTGGSEKYCVACFNRDYPVPIQEPERP